MRPRRGIESSSPKVTPDGTAQGLDWYLYWRSRTHRNRRNCGSGAVKEAARHPIMTRSQSTGQGIIDDKVRGDGQCATFGFLRHDKGSTFSRIFGLRGCKATLKR